MDPKKDPTRRCLRVGDWPEPDRRAWAICLQEGDPLDPGGPGSNWAPLTRKKNANGYGRWLTWLITNGMLDPELPPGDRVLPERVAAYIGDLRTLNRSNTIVFRVQELHLAISAMVPDRDWRWIQRIERRLRMTTSACDKGASIIHSSDLFAYGLELMAEADRSAVDNPLRGATAYRDGLMISMLAARPLRRKNFCSIEIGRHLTSERGIYLLSFDAAETKTHEPIEASIPTDLVPYLERYLMHHRAILVERTGRWNRIEGTNPQQTSALFVSRDGSKMTEIAIYLRITKRTQSRFGHAVNPHLFRDSAATSIAVEDPDRVHIVRSILGHTTLRTSERHYNHAQSMDALRRYQGRISELRRRGQGT
jgi:hypothetical protein